LQFQKSTSDDSREATLSDKEIASESESEDFLQHEQNYSSRSISGRPPIGNKFTVESTYESSRELRNKTPIVKFEETKSDWTITIVIVSVVIISFAVVVSSLNRQSNLSVGANCSQFLDLQTEYPNQDKKIFKSLKYGVEATANGNPPEATVFSFFSTDQKVLERILSRLVEITRNCIHQSEEPLVLRKDQLGNKMVDNLREELRKRTIMIVNNLEKASPSDVSYLHSFCDTENPLIRKSIIFLTVKVPNGPQGKPVEYITEYLNDHWKTLPDNIRQPFITRILDQTFFLEP
jgi:hypothetical protein